MSEHSRRSDCANILIKTSKDSSVLRDSTARNVNKARLKPLIMTQSNWPIK